MKKYIQHNLIIFALINICFPLLSSENNWSLKPKSSHTNWFTSKIDAFSQKMVTRHSYTHNSFEHMRDMAILHLLPAPIAQATLFAQRNNMKKFLLKNEENALEGVRQYWGFDQKEWSRIMSQIRKNREFNLSEMRKDQDFNTYHDPSLPTIWIDTLKKECKRHDINPKSLNFGTMEKPGIGAHAYEYLPSCNNYNPGGINFNTNDFNKENYPKDEIRYIAAHELMHIIQGHNSRAYFLRPIRPVKPKLPIDDNSLRSKILENYHKSLTDYKKTMEIYNQSSVYNNLIAADKKRPTLF